MVCGKVISLLPLTVLLLAFFSGPVTGAGVLVTDGAVITSPYGSTSPVITVTDADIAQNGIITIDITDLHQCTAGFALTSDNIIVDDTAVNAVWTATIDGNNLNLTSTGNDTVTGETVTVTFTGARGSPWIADTYGPWEFHPTVTRADGLGAADFAFLIETVSPTPIDLDIANGGDITTTAGSSSPVITVRGSDIAQDSTITIDVTPLNEYVATGGMTSQNIIVNDTAGNANWTGTVDHTILTLTSGGGPTLAGENISVTFTGEKNPWIANTSGPQIVPLSAVRTDGFGSGSFSIVFDISPPPGPIPQANFSASPVADLAPLIVSFTDTSLNNPTSWTWDFGDGSHSATRNPVHTYNQTGTYTVSLTASNIHGSGTLTRSRYIRVLNGVTRVANTSINGLIVSYDGSGQVITVNTSLLPASCIPDSSVLEIQPPAGSGLKNITVYAVNGTIFSQQGVFISGRPAIVHLVSEEIAPPGGFSDPVGPNSSFNYSFSLDRYPENHQIQTKIQEGIAPQTDSLLRKVTSGNDVFIVGTAYTAAIAGLDSLNVSHAVIHMSLNSSWNPSLSGGPGRIYIWRVSGDESEGEIRPTTFRGTNPALNLDYYEAESPRGLSTFGISSFSGNNNPFQLITFVLAGIISEPQPAPGINNPDEGAGSQKNAVSTVSSTIIPQPTQEASYQERTAKIYANSAGTITQATALTSFDGHATVVIGLGTVARDRDGKPLSSVTIAGILPGDIPPAPAGFVGLSGGTAYELRPDGAEFSPGILFSVNAPAGSPMGQEFVVKSYERSTGTWKDIPSVRDPRNGTVTAQVSHFCPFAVFARVVTVQTPSGQTTQVSQPVATAGIPPPSNAMGIAGGMFVWLVNLIATNLMGVAIVIILTGTVVLFRKRRGRNW